MGGAANISSSSSSPSSNRSSPLPDGFAATGGMAGCMWYVCVCGVCVWCVCVCERER